MDAGMDGVRMTRPPVQPGQEFVYDFVVPDAGTFFFHPHIGLQLDRGLSGVLIVDPVIPLPFVQQEHVIVLDDWAAGIPSLTIPPTHSAYLMNGKTSNGQYPYLVNQGDTVRFRFVNASGNTNYVVSLDGHPMTVTHTDGQPVVPTMTTALPIGMGERYTVEVTANNPGAWSLAAASLMNRNTTLVRGIFRYNGSTAVNPSANYAPPAMVSAPLLTYDLLQAAGPVTPISSAPTVTHSVSLARFPAGGPNAWTLNGAQFPNTAPLQVSFGDTVRVNMTSLTPHHHPMHLHGHYFRVLNTLGGTTQPLVKDTVLMQNVASAQTSFEFVADNPGPWMFHCHNLYHAEGGMMTMVMYTGADQDQDGLGDGMDLDPLSPFPVLTATSNGGGFTIGSTPRLQLQWPANNVGYFFIGSAVPSPINIGTAGFALINPVVLLGSGVANANDQIELFVNIPNSPFLIGGVAELQGAAFHPTLPGGLKASTYLQINIY
jgi:FtsP/CotA-like multicopper oxidase with cupredoxin domain